MGVDRVDGRPRRRHRRPGRRSGSPPAFEHYYNTETLSPEGDVVRGIDWLGNAGFVRNLIEKARDHRNSRLDDADLDALLAAKAHIEAQGIDVVGPTFHGIFRSIYFFDPNGHRLELACNIGTPEQYAALKRVAPLMLAEWSETKKAPRHADWLHVDPDKQA